ncbi:MAG: head GIN domain-containing protein [Flavobacteriaceae bacterium]|nr:head GIN domain-containing protein [Flavobacteriaceae bacterium]
MKSIIKFIVLLLVIISTTSCVLTGTKGNSHVTSEERTPNSSFDGIKVSQGISLFLTQGNDEKIIVETDENLQDILITKVNNNNILEVYFDENVRKATTKNVYVTAKNINLLSTSSGASLTSEDVINSESVQLKSNSGSSIRVEIVSNDVTSTSSSGSSIKIIGKTKIFSAKSSSGATIRADRFEADEVEAKVSSGASIDVFATDVLVATASSGGSIDYEGTPKRLVKNTSSGGSVHKN